MIGILINVKRCVIKNKALTKFINIFIKIYALKTPKEIVRRESLSIFNFIDLAKPIKYYPFYNIKENNLYGHGKALFNALQVGVQEDDFHIEHGLILGSLVQEGLVLSYARKILTFSNYRYNQIKAKTNKNVILVGPYIQYAKEMMGPKEFNIIKNKLGRVILVFPSHSTKQTETEFEVLEIQHYILNYKEEFDNVLVCLYWKDILLGKDKLYKQMGYKVVTAGHIYDYNFINRLNFIIKLSDFTISNSVGTHVGYCVFLGKPHIILNTEISHKPISIIETNLYQRGQDELDKFNLATKEILEVFSTKQDSVTIEQIKCVEYYWGKFAKQ